MNTHAITTNSLSEQLSKVMLSQENIVKILVGFQDAMISNKNTIELELDNFDGSRQKYQIPTNSYLYREIKAIVEKDKVMEEIISGNRAFLVGDDGTYREVVASSFRQTIHESISDLPISNILRVDNTSFLHDMIQPTTKMIITLDNAHKFVQKVQVRMIKILNESDWIRFENRDELAKVYATIRNNAVQYEEYNGVQNTDPRIPRYYGAFDAMEVEHNSDGTQTVRLASLGYNDARSISGTRTLTNGDNIVSADGSTRFKIVNTDYSTSRIRLERIFGSGSIIPESAACHYYDQNVDDARTVAIPVKANEKVLVFISLVNPTNDMTSAWSRCYKIDTSNFKVVENDNEINFSTYFSSKVLNIGEYLKQLINESTIPMSLGVVPTKPLVEPEFFKVVQVNTHLTENSDIQKLNRLNTQKVTVFNEVSGLTERISDTRARINAGNYASQKERERDIQDMDRMISEKNKKSELYASIVRDISSKLTSDQLDDLAPKFRIRGFWPIQAPMTSQFTRDQRIIKYRVQYRYLSTTNETSQTRTYKYYDAEGREIIGAFSDWNEMSTVTLRKVKRADGSYDWDDVISENADELNINQLDVSIRPGEAVEVRIRACGEAGYPISFTESDWSDIVRVDFPAELLGISDLSKSLSANTEDLRKVELESILKNEGITEHTVDAFREQSKYFAHSAHSIASGFYTTEQRTISLYEFVNALVGRIGSLEDRLARRAAALKLEILDGNTTHSIQRFSTLRLFAGYYTTSVDMSTPANHGTIVEKMFYLKITNPTSQLIELLSLDPGILTDSTTNLDYQDVAISIPGTGVTARQRKGQILYSRMKDLAGVNSLYNDLGTPSSSVITGGEIDTGAPVGDRNVYFNNGTTIQAVKLQPTLTTNNWIALHKDHPYVAAYAANASPENLVRLNDELTRVQKINASLKTPYNYKYTADLNVEFDPNDKYTVGANSCGARLLVKVPSIQFVQVSGSDNASFREVQPGEANAILVPIAFQFRMSDALGHVDGVTTKDVNDNFDYVKKIGVDILIAGDMYRFDLEVVAKFRPTTLSNADVPISILDQIKKAVLPSTDPSASI